jgi:RNA polymerase sigma factor (sigma-70 family)
VTPLPNERAQWLATHILPLEPQLRHWLKRNRSKSLDPDDLIQAAYEKLAALASVANIQQPRAYFYKIIRRLVVDQLRRADVVSIESVAEISELAPADEIASPERILAGYQDLEMLVMAISALPESMKIVFVLKKIDDLSQKEIATRLNISEGMVEKRLSQAGKAITQTNISADGRKLIFRPSSIGATGVRTADEARD